MITQYFGGRCLRCVDVGGIQKTFLRQKRFSKKEKKNPLKLFLMYVLKYNAYFFNKHFAENHLSLWLTLQYVFFFCFF